MGADAARQTTYDVRIWAVKKVPSAKAGAKKNDAAYRLRWMVAGRERSATFATVALAESERAELLAATRRGEAFDVASGLPLSKLPPPEEVKHAWWDWALTYMDLKWPTLAPNSRRSMAEALTDITLALLTSEDGRPPVPQLRAAMARWAFVTPRRQAEKPDAKIARSLRWLAANTADVTTLEDPARVRAVLTALSRRKDGTLAAATTFARKRAVLFNALDLAVEHQLMTRNPLETLRWRSPKPPESIDPACVVNPTQARALLAAVGTVGVDRRKDKTAPPAKGRPLPPGGPFVAFFGCMYHAGLRPSEVIALTRADVELPDEEGEWGWLRLSTSDAEVPSRWTDSGRRQTRQLKHRARGSVRPVPCSPELVALLRAHLDEYGVGPGGRVFRGGQGAPIRVATYNAVWQAARKAALTPAEFASPLGARPYDLRHSCVSTWLAAGVESPKIAAWVGHSVAVLHRVYAHVLPDRDDSARQQIAALMRG